VVGITSMLVLIGLASRTEIMGLAAIIAVSSVMYMLQNRLRSPVGETSH
jgi:hypothetical protein